MSDPIRRAFDFAYEHAPAEVRSLSGADALWAQFQARGGSRTMPDEQGKRNGRMPPCATCGHCWGDHARPPHIDADVDGKKERWCFALTDSGECRCRNYVQPSPEAAMIASLRQEKSELLDMLEEGLTGWCSQTYERVIGALRQEGRDVNDDPSPEAVPPPVEQEPLPPLKSGQWLKGTGDALRAAPPLSQTDRAATPEQKKEL